jgi:hypothetical protein
VRRRGELAARGPHPHGMGGEGSRAARSRVPSYFDARARVVVFLAVALGVVFARVVFAATLASSPAARSGVAVLVLGALFCAFAPGSSLPRVPASGLDPSCKWLTLRAKSPSSNETPCERSVFANAPNVAAFSPAVTTASVGQLGGA